MLSPETIEKILHACQEGILVIDCERRIVFWNQWISRYSGVDREKAQGRHLQEMLPGMSGQHLDRAIQACNENSGESTFSNPAYSCLLYLQDHEGSAGDSGSPVERRAVVQPLDDGGKRFCLIRVGHTHETTARASTPADNTHSKPMVPEAATIIEHIHDAIVCVGPDGRITDLNHAAHQMFNREDAQVLGEPAGILFQRYDAHLPALRCGETVEMRAHRHPRAQFSAAVGMSRIQGPDGDRCILIVRDVTQQKQDEESLHREKEFAQITLQSIQEAVITTDHRGRVNSANAAACELLRRQRDQILDRPLLDLLTFSEMEHRRAARQGITNTLSQGKSCSMSGVPELRFDNQESIFINGRLAPLRSRDGDIIGSVAVLQDITNEKRMREILSYQATHDDLTSLINRREFERRLDEALSTRVGDTPHVLLYMDLDQFKLINDNCGHTAGDQMLRQLTALLNRRLRHTDTLARLGGDEFAALLPYCGLEMGRRIAEELRELVRDFRFHWGGRNFGVGVSIGIVELDESMLSTSDALAAADSACYIAKENGRDQVVLHRPNGDEEQQRKGLINQAVRIRDSLEQHRFRLWAQPIVPIQPGRYDWGVEILVRMLDEDGSLVSPGLFIPAAERYNLMGHIDTWVVSEVCRQWVAQPNLFERLDKVAINLSGQSIANDEFLELVMTQIDNSGVPWHKLCFEVTETAAVSSMEKARHFIKTLKERGARFSLDDFGSGLSSFAYLKQLPVDYLKIDGAFVRDMLSNSIDAAMVRSISDVGRAIGLRSIAEFVEDMAIVEALREAEVDFAQGYGICKPKPIEELADYQPPALAPTPALAKAVR